MPDLTIHAGTLTAILVMAGVSGLNRIAGFYLMRLVPLTPRVRKILDALPGAVLVAMLAPGAVKGDAGMVAGLIAAFILARATRSDFLAVLGAMAVAAGTRAFF